MNSLTHRSGQVCPSLWATLPIRMGNVVYMRWANVPTAWSKTDHHTATYGLRVLVLIDKHPSFITNINAIY